MPRRLKPQKVGDLIKSDKAPGLSAEVYLDRDELDFFAKVGADTIRAASVKELRPLVVAAFIAMMDVEILEVISIQISSGSRFQSENSGITLSFDRFAWYRAQDGMLYKISWDDREGQTWGVEGNFRSPLECSKKFYYG